MPYATSRLPHRLPALLLLCTFALLANAAAATGGYTKVQAVEGITEYRLDNGLRVLLAPDHTAELTTIDLTYLVGSRNEHLGQGGLSHVLEHLMLKGTPTQPDISTEFQRHGLTVEAGASVDRTRYTATFAASATTMGWYLDRQADSMLNTGTTSADVQAVRPEILAEIQERDQSPPRLLRQKMRGAAFHWHQYGNDPMGTQTDIASIHAGRLQAYYGEYYQPDNAILTVTGKFDTASTLCLIVRSLGKLPRPRRNIPDDYRTEPLQDGNHAVTLRRPGSQPLVAAMYHIPPSRSPDYTLMMLAADILATGTSRRLHDELVASGMPGNVSSQALGGRDYGLIEFRAALKPGMDTEGALRILNRTVETVRLFPYTAEELNLARRRWLSHWSQVQGEPQALAEALSRAASYGDWRLFFLERNRVRDATLADVQQVAERYLTRGNRTEGRYVPTDTPDVKPSNAPIDLGPELERYDIDVD